ncbi:hypothetical protein V7S43_005381 [Phytophthora oleae]|uniref:Uncharacterized protein n=1 Tax=Phytophthora oleae TaxID=2107226 RepID=A0ABD3FYG8_9STRA
MSVSSTRALMLYDGISGPKEDQKSDDATPRIFACISESKTSSDSKWTSFSASWLLKTLPTLWSSAEVLKTYAKALFVVVMFHASLSKIHRTHMPAPFAC